jgi:hypothetical protein
VLVVQSLLDFTVAVSPSIVSVIQGSEATTTVTVFSVGGFSSPVNLLASNVPSGILVVFGTNTITPPVGGVASSIVTVAASPTSSAGTYSITIAAVSGDLTHSVSLTALVTPVPAPDFSLSAAPPTLTLGQSSTATGSISVLSKNGFSSPVTLSGSWVTSAPTGLTFTIPGPITPLPNSTATSTLTITTSSGAPSGNYTIRITGTSSGLSHYIEISITVTAPQCVIATATYGSELAPEVQVLRNFRDQEITKTYAGANFMIAFNTWYYSFSPGVARYITQYPLSRDVMKPALYPLVGIMTLGAALFRSISAYPEAAAVVSGLMVSSLIGITYLAVPITIAWKFSSRARHAARRLEQTLGIILCATLLAVLIIEFFHAAAFLMVISSAMAVLTMMSTSALIASRMIVRAIEASMVRV